MVPLLQPVYALFVSRLLLIPRAGFDEGRSGGRSRSVDVALFDAVCCDAADVFKLFPPLLLVVRLVVVPRAVGDFCLRSAIMLKNSSPVVLIVPTSNEINDKR